jgi:hypothetical protein
MSFQTPAGTPSNGQELHIFVRSNNAASGWTMAWTTGYTGGKEVSTSIPNFEGLPATLVTGRMLLLTFHYVTAGSLNRWFLDSTRHFAQ